MISTFTTTFKNLAIGGGTQWIGWDPIAKGIRSWTFETGGGFGEATWTQDGDKWLLKAACVVRERQKLAASKNNTKIHPDTHSRGSTTPNRNRKALPDV